MTEKAEIVRAIYQWYAHGMDGRTVGCNLIAIRLNEMGLTTDLGNPFTRSTIAQMLRNPAYIGKVRWAQKVTTYRIENGVRVKSRVRNPEALLIDGLHDPIVDTDLWQQVQDMFATHEKPAVAMPGAIVNPLAGIMVCGVCGHMMTYKPVRNRRGDTFACRTERCPTREAYVFAVEDAVLDILRSWVDRFEADRRSAPSTNDIERAARETALRQQLETRERLAGQFARLYDLLEQGLYTAEIYRERHAELTRRIAETDARIAELERRPDQDDISLIIPRVRTVLAAYSKATSGAEKNTLLRSVIERVTYHKTERCYRNNAPGDHLSLEISPRIPKGLHDN